MEKEQNLYEVTELQEYNEKREYQQFRDNRKRKKQSFTMPCCFFGIIVIVSILLIIGLLIAVLVSENLNQDSTSDNVQMTKPNEGSNSTSDGSCMSGPTSSPTISLPNCTIVHTEWANEIQAEMDQLKRLIQTQFSNLINKSEESASKIDDIRTFTDIQTEKCLNNSEDIKNILEVTEKSAAKLMNIVNTLSNLQDTSTSTNGVVDDILLVVQELLVLHNDSTALPTSCKEVKERQPNSPSGVYLLVTPNGGGNTYTAYCNMDELCGSGGGWTRVAHLDMSDSSQNCPSGFTLYQLGSVRACSRPSGGGNCASVKFPSNGISYSHVCGRVTGYQYGTPDAVNPHVNNINSYYLDGISITHGSPRQHIWSFYCGVDSQLSHLDNCPCAGGTATQAFVGNDYFCESGNPNANVVFSLYLSDPVWDGQGCGPNEGDCCSVPGIPWFNKTLSASSTDYIELRQCCDQDITNEDVKVSYYEIYIQ